MQSCGQNSRRHSWPASARIQPSDHPIQPNRTKVKAAHQLAAKSGRRGHLSVRLIQPPVVLERRQFRLGEVLCKLRTSNGFLAALGRIRSFDSAQGCQWRLAWQWRRISLGFSRFGFCWRGRCCACRSQRLPDGLDWIGCERSNIGETHRRLPAAAATLFMVGCKWPL